MRRFFFFFFLLLSGCVSLATTHNVCTSTNKWWPPTWSIACSSRKDGRPTGPRDVTIPAVEADVEHGHAGGRPAADGHDVGHQRSTEVPEALAVLRGGCGTHVSGARPRHSGGAPLQHVPLLHPAGRQVRLRSPLGGLCPCVAGLSSPQVRWMLQWTLFLCRRSMKPASKMKVAAQQTVLVL